LARHFEYYFNVDLAGGNVQVRDAYFDTRFSDAFRVRFGKAKAPVSYERLILVSNIIFVERGMTTAVAPDRDVGVQVLGDFAGTVVSYTAALTNGVVDGASADADANDGKDIAARLVVRPFVRTGGGRLAGLGVAIAGNTGIQAGALPSFPSPGRQTFYSYAGAVASGRRTRWSPQAFYYRGPFGGYAEYVQSTNGVQKAGVVDDVDHRAWQAVASWVVTGEAAGERNVRPRINFDPPSRHFGALQLAVRFQGLSVSRNAFARGFTASGASRAARSWTVGANWYLNPFVKWNLNFDRTVFDGDPHGPRKAENAILLRAHLGF
jgi:phosphate-selective porin OprO/OprP